MYGLATLALLAASVSGVSAHGGVLSYSIAGKWYDGWKAYNSPAGQSTIQRPWATYNPIQDPADPTIACNDDGNSADGQQTATIQAGQSIVQYWNQIWPHDTGPVLTYLAKCPGNSCTGVNAKTLKWFKIQEAGLLSGTVGNGQWAAGKMIADNSSWTTTIPASVPAGNYLIRSETIALHSMPAQFYPECAQITITGSGTLEPTSAQLVSFPGAYKASDPGVTIDLYSNAALSQSTYVIPGPPLYGSSAPSNPPASTVNPPATTVTRPATTVNPPATTVRPPTTSAPAGTIAQYGQCGGSGWSGATACKSPFTCTKLNDYYSQCL